MRTAQQLFDTVATHLRMQAGVCADVEGLCRYRGIDDDTKCAVGALIPNEVYRPDMEKKGVSALISSGLLPAGLSEEFSTNIELLNRLQGIHDSYPIDRWEEQLARAAREHQLQYTPPEKP